MLKKFLSTQLFSVHLQLFIPGRGGYTLHCRKYRFCIVNTRVPPGIERMGEIRVLTRGLRAKTH